MSEATVETTASAASESDAPHGELNVVFAENQAIHEQLDQLAKAIQEKVAISPARETDRDAYVVYGLCMLVPRASGQAHDEHALPELPEMNVLLLTAHANDWHTMKLVEIEGRDSAETRRLLSNMLGAMQKALALDADDDLRAPRDLVGARFEGAGAANGALPHQKLSEREFQVVHMLSMGKTVGAISKELNLSVKTVSTYRVRALKKMNFKTNAELIRYMIQYKLG